VPREPPLSLAALRLPQPLCQGRGRQRGGGWQCLALRLGRSSAGGPGRLRGDRTAAAGAGPVPAEDPGLGAAGEAETGGTSEAQSGGGDATTSLGSGGDGRDGDSVYPSLCSLCVLLAGRAGRGLPALHGEAGEAGEEVMGGLGSLRGPGAGDAIGALVRAKGTPCSCPCPAPQIQELEERLAVRDGEKERLGKEVEALQSRLSSLEVGAGSSWQCQGRGCAGADACRSVPPEREGEHQLRHRDAAGRGGRPA